MIDLSHTDCALDAGSIPRLVGRATSVTDSYALAQLEMHWGRTRSEGSEHYIEGKQYAAEMHFVHYNTRYANLSEAMDAEVRKGATDALIIVAQVLNSAHARTQVYLFHVQIPQEYWVRQALCHTLEASVSL